MPYSDTEHGAHDIFAQSVAGRPSVLDPALEMLAAAKNAAKNDAKSLERIAWDDKYFQMEWVEAAKLAATENRFGNLRKLDELKHGEDYIYVGGIKNYPTTAKSLRFAFKAKGKAKCRFLFKKQGGDAEPVVLDIDASDFTGFAFEAPSGLRARSFLVYMTDWIEFKDFSIHAIL